MAADTRTPQRSDRKPWHAPRVERLVAADAENLYTPVSKDGVYSTS